MTTAAIPVSHTDPTNQAILAISEDRIQGFEEEPFLRIAELSGVPIETVLERIRAMLEAGTIRRVRQTLVATNLAEGALVAWKVPPAKLDEAFDFLFKNDPFSGHVVLRSTDAATTGSQYRLWTTLKVPQGCSLETHCALLAPIIGAEGFKIMPARGFFVLGVGHVRRSQLEPGARSDAPAQMNRPAVVELSDLEWRVLTELKREFAPEEIRNNPWKTRAEAAQVELDEFIRVARDLDHRKVIGRFSTFLEHVKPTGAGERVTRFNALFHWAVPQGLEERAGCEVGRHLVLTHAYWREGGPEFGNVNIMAVAHGTDKTRVLEHKAAIDAHLAAEGIPVTYTNVFWGGRSEIKPSEISPVEYRKWYEKMRNA
jgi:hypothetical protein